MHFYIMKFYYYINFINIIIYYEIKFLYNFKKFLYIKIFTNIDFY